MTQKNEQSGSNSAAKAQPKPLNDGLCLQLLEEMKRETKEYLEDYIDSEDIDRGISNLVMTRLEDFFDRKIYEMKRKA